VEDLSDCTTEVCNTPESGVQTEISSDGNNSSNSSTSTASTPNLVTTNPIPIEFPVQSLNFGFFALEVFRTGILSERGKREITSELVKGMQKYERFVVCFCITRLLPV